jgi:hypothetical protein
MDYMIPVDFSVSLDNSFIFGEEEGDIQYHQAEFVENKQEDIEIVISTTEIVINKGKSC